MASKGEKVSPDFRIEWDMDGCPRTCLKCYCLVMENDWYNHVDYCWLKRRKSDGK